MLDRKRLFANLHCYMTDELSELMNGFYHNIEDGLFELAYSNPDAKQRKIIAGLMRDLRARQRLLLEKFNTQVASSAQDWLEADCRLRQMDDGAYKTAEQIAAKCAAHFSPVLQSIAERTSYATQQNVARQALPLSPEKISYHFVIACKSADLQSDSALIIQSLFRRFVLDRLGLLYGEINAELRQAGCTSLAERNFVGHKVGPFR